MANKKPAFQLKFDRNDLLQQLYGEHDAYLHKIEEALSVRLVTRGNKMAIFGEEKTAHKAKIVLEDLYTILKNDGVVEAQEVDAALRVTTSTEAEGARPADVMHEGAGLVTPCTKIIPRSERQQEYIQALKNSTLTFGLGPAGTGKTFLATAYGASLLAQHKVKRLILTRPVVEAGEHLGFLPGTFEEKIDPYLRPFFDALHDTLGQDRVEKLREQGDIEIAPLAYMRGRTLNDCVMILDEAQNTTPAQMKMFLTRLGQNSTMIVAGDTSQCDLPAHQKSGLNDAVGVLEFVEGVKTIRFTEADVVRHVLVSRIVKAYDDRTE